MIYSGYNSDVISRYVAYIFGLLMPFIVLEGFLSSDIRNAKIYTEQLGSYFISYKAINGFESLSKVKLEINHNEIECHFGVTESELMIMPLWVERKTVPSLSFPLSNVNINLLNGDIEYTILKQTIINVIK